MGGAIAPLVDIALCSLPINSSRLRMHPSVGHVSSERRGCTRARCASRVRSPADPRQIRPLPAASAVCTAQQPLGMSVSAASHWGVQHGPHGRPGSLSALLLCRAVDVGSAAVAKLTLFFFRGNYCRFLRRMASARRVLSRALLAACCLASVPRASLAFVLPMLRSESPPCLFAAPPATVRHDAGRSRFVRNARNTHAPRMGKASAEALEDIVVADIGDTSDERLWVPQTDCLSFKPLCLSVSSGYYVNLLRFKGGGVLGCHRHSSPVHAHTIKGHWGYVEHGWGAESRARVHAYESMFVSTCI